MSRVQRPFDHASRLPPSNIVSTSLIMAPSCLVSSLGMASRSSSTSTAELIPGLPLSCAIWIGMPKRNLACFRRGQILISMRDAKLQPGHAK